MRSRLASRLAADARRRRHEQFFPLTGAGSGSRILDVGCGSRGLRAAEPSLAITGLDITPRPDYPGPFVRADARERLPFDDDAFDLVYCNSVVEHITRADRAHFAEEIRRVGRGWLVQTPAWSFPIEPHALLPFAHWLPPRILRYYWGIGVAEGWEEITLLRRSEFEGLFGPALPERAGPLTKSWVSIRSVEGQTVTGLV